MTSKPNHPAIDGHLDKILRASGSALRHYTMQKSLDDMRGAVIATMEAGKDAASAEIEVLRKLSAGFIVLGFKSDLDSPAYISDTFATFSEADAHQEICGYWISRIEAVNVRPWPKRDIQPIEAVARNVEVACATAFNKVHAEAEKLVRGKRISTFDMLFDLRTAVKAYGEACASVSAQQMHDQYNKGFIAGSADAQASASAASGESILVEAVAEMGRSNYEEGTNFEPRLDWLVEGGEHAIPYGTLLLMAHKPITGDDGSGQVYLAPCPSAQGGAA